MRSNDDPCRCPDECRYFCPIHATHHVVPGLVESCVEKATAPVEEQAPKRTNYPLAS